MNHILKEVTENKEENMKTYYNPKLALQAEMTTVIEGFINNYDIRIRN